MFEVAKLGAIAQGKMVHELALAQLLDLSKEWSGHYFESVLLACKESHELNQVWTYKRVASSVKVMFINGLNNYCFEFLMETWSSLNKLLLDCVGNLDEEHGRFG